MKNRKQLAGRAAALIVALCIMQPTGVKADDPFKPPLGKSLYPAVSSGLPSFINPIMSQTEIVEIAKKSCFTLLAGNGSGTAFLIGNGLLVTNCHVIAGAIKNGLTGWQIASTISNKSYPVDGVIDYDADHDLALLACKAAYNIEPLKMGDRSDQTKDGSQIYVFGSPEGMADSFVPGTISGFRQKRMLDYDTKIANAEARGEKNLPPRRLIPNDPTGDVIQISAPVSHGNSGGPVLNNRAMVIGIVYRRHDDHEVSGAENMNYAISARCLRDLLIKNHYCGYFDERVMPLRNDDFKRSITDFSNIEKPVMTDEQFKDAIEKAKKILKNSGM